jgi:uncharacterized membrane protein YphA (DoxX/SURF4 family)
MVKVPSDPAQVIVNHASFRVQLGATSARALGGTARIPVIPSAVHPSAAARRREVPLAWSGRSEPGDPAATQPLHAVHGGNTDSWSTTQVLPRIEEHTRPLPRVVEPRRPSGLGPEEMLGGVRPGRGAYGDKTDCADERFTAAPSRRRAEPPRRAHAWYPGRRMNLGIVLLPLRIFLGVISIYAGMGKLCDPVYFDGGRHGSMVNWLASLHPWAAAEPLRDLAVGHPVAAGLTIAFLQVIAGVLTVCGLWQRVAASIGVLLSAALLVTVSWRTVPVYEMPNIIYLAAWSPLVIAGAPVYSVDGRLASEAWRRLGPRAALWELRLRVLRRGTVLATLLAGLSLVVGSMLGAAVRSTGTDTRIHGPSDLPTNNQEGSPLPEVPGGRSAGASSAPSARRSTTPSPSASSSASKSASPSAQSSSGAGGGHGTPRRPSARPTPAHSSHSSAPTPSSGGSKSGGSSDSGGALGGLLGSGERSGWLLGMRDGSGAAPVPGGSA